MRADVDDAVLQCHSHDAGDFFTMNREPCAASPTPDQELLDRQERIAVAAFWQALGELFRVW